MAAYSACMCVLRNCRPVILSHSFVRSVICSNAYKRMISGCVTKPVYKQNCCLYSTQINDGSKGLTDDILKDKIVIEAAQQAADDKNTKSESSGDGSEKKSGRWTGKNAWKLGLVFLGGWGTLTGSMLVYYWGSPPLDPEGKEIEDEFSKEPHFTAMFKRAFKEMNLYKKKIQEPSRDRLLPDPLEYPYYQPPYTLVLEMNSVLVHPEWTYSTGWRFKKRPGIDYFLSQIGPPLFEVVVYSQEQGMTADPLISHLDPRGSIMYRLYRDATRYQDGHHLKDLSCLNRDLSKVIMIDWDNEATKLQPHNRLVIPKWKGNDDDRTLIDLAHFLKTIAASEVSDVRTVLEYYSQFDDPVQAFRENQRKFQEEEERMEAIRKEQEDKKKTRWGFAGMFKR